MRDTAYFWIACAIIVLAFAGGFWMLDVGLSAVMLDVTGA